LPRWIKGIWIFATIVNAVSIIWFLLGSTANFQRSLDWVGFLTLLFIWIPSLLLVLFSSMILLKKWVPASNNKYSGLSLLIFLLLSLSAPLFEGVTIRGWLYDNVHSDPMKLTSDGKYEYQTQLINTNQKNRSERLYVRNVSTGEEMYITVDINTDELVGLSFGGKNWAWAILEPTGVPNQYVLSTTEMLDMPKKKFLIDISAGVSRRLE
jgi:hypothetical protein